MNNAPKTPEHGCVLPASSLRMLWRSFRPAADDVRSIRRSVCNAVGLLGLFSAAAHCAQAQLPPGAYVVPYPGGPTPGFRPATTPPNLQPAPQAPASAVRVPSRPAAGPPVQPTPEPQVNTHQTLVELASGHPVCVVIGEGIASSFVGMKTTDEGPFQDFVMGAQVNGIQKTNARTSLDFTPDASAAKMLFVLKGVTANETVAQLPRAAVRSAGTFEFELTKQIEFNGQGIRTWSPSAFMTVRQQNLGASTAVSNVPLLGPLANNIVLNVADQRKPISEGIAAHRVTQQVAPQFNSRLDQELAKLNESLHGSWKTKLVDAGLQPSRISTLTTNDAMLCGLEFQAALAEAADASGTQILKSTRPLPTRLITRQLIAGSSPNYGADPGMTAPAPYSLDSKTLRDRACLLLHATLIENLAARMHLAGREVADTQLMKLMGTASKTTASGPQLYTLLFDKELPVVASVNAGEIVLELRVAVRPVIGPELPTQIIRVAIRPELMDDKIQFQPVLRTVEPLIAADSAATSSAASTLIRQVIEPKLQTFSVPRNFDLVRQADRPSFAVRVQQLTLVDGWITAILEEPLPSRSADAEADPLEEAAATLR